MTYNVISAAIEINKSLGLGLLDSINECMKHDLSLWKYTFFDRNYMPVSYKRLEVATSLRCDLFVEAC